MQFSITWRRRQAPKPRALIFAMLAVAALLGPGRSWAAGGSLQGRVLQDDGAGLGGVTVMVEGLGRETITDSKGRYAFDGVPEGTYTLAFSLGDRSAREDVVVSGDRPTAVETRVDWIVTFGETITVLAASRRAERIVEAPAAVTTLTTQEVERWSAAGQLPRLLATTSGAEAPQSGIYDFNLNARGFNDFVNRRVLTLIDGRDPSIPVFLGGQQWAAISSPLEEFETVELVLGPGAALYGAGAFNGVLNLITKKPRASQGGRARLTFGELNTRRLEARHASDLGAGWYAKVMGGYQENDDFTRSRVGRVEYGSGLLPQEVVPPRLDRNELAFGSLRLDRYLAKGRVLTLEGGTAVFEGTTFVTGSGRFHQTDVDRPWARVNLNSQHWNLLGYYTEYGDDELINLGSGGAQYIDSYNAALEFQGNREFADSRGRVVAGVSYSEQSVDSVDPRGVQTLFESEVSSENQAVFGQVDYYFTDRLRGVLSARWDESDLTDSELSPRAALVFAVTPQHTLRLVYGEAFQRPTLAQLFVEVEVMPALDLSALEAALAPLLGGVPLRFERIPFLAVGNDSLEAETVRGLEVGYFGILGQKVLLTASYFRNELESFTTQFLPQVGTSLGRLNPSFGPYAPPSALSPGASAAVLGALGAALPGQLLVFLSNDADGLPVFALVSFANFGRVDTEGLEINLDYVLNPEWTVDVSYAYFDFETREEIPENPVVPNAPEHRFHLGLTYQGERLGGSLGYRWVDSLQWASGIFAGPVPSYEVVDLSLTYELNDSWQLGLDVANLLDDVHYEVFGGDLLERRALAHVSVNW